MDNDVYGHVNNVAYYSYFDTAANAYLIAEGGLDIAHGPVIGLVVESRCSYHAALAFPQPLVAGVRVDKLGTSSVTYGIAIFAGAEPLAAAHGHFVHVFVDRVTRAPRPIPRGTSGGARAAYRRPVSAMITRISTIRPAGEKPR